MVVIEQLGENDWKAACPECPDEDPKRGFKKQVHDWAGGHDAWHLARREQQTRQEKLDALKAAGG